MSFFLFYVHQLAYTLLFSNSLSNRSLGGKIQKSVPHLNCATIKILFYVFFNNANQKPTCSIRKESDSQLTF